MPELNIPPVVPNPEAKSVEVLVRRGAAELEARGVNWRRIADSHGLDLDREPAPGRSIPTERENAFLMEATQAVGDLLFTWHLGRVDVRSYGLPMYASLNASTVGEAMELARLLTPTLCEAVALNVVVDVLYGAINPRIRHGR